jgi:hypothetical protein
VPLDRPRAGIAECHLLKGHVLECSAGQVPPGRHRPGIAIAERDVVEAHTALSRSETVADRRRQWVPGDQQITRPTEPRQQFVHRADGRIGPTD